MVENRQGQMAGLEEQAIGFGLLSLDVEKLRAQKYHEVLKYEGKINPTAQ